MLQRERSDFETIPYSGKFLLVQDFVALPPSPLEENLISRRSSGETTSTDSP